jgi:glycosyltransferase involved in cell wall biosynthesis
VSKIKVLICSDSPFVHTGFAQQAREIATYLGNQSDKYEVNYLAWFTNGWKNAKDYIPVPFETYSTTVTHAACDKCKSKTPMIEHVGKDGSLYRYDITPDRTIVASTNECTNVTASKVTSDDKYGLYSFSWIVQMLKPQIVISVGDIWMIESYTRGPFKKNYTLISYMPVDGNPWPTSTRQSGQINDYGGYEISWKSTLANVDRIVAYTEYGANVINELLGVNACADYVWHGCDTTNLTPMPPDEKKLAKIKFFQRESVTLLDGTRVQVNHDDTVITNTSRNQPRKGYPILFEAFAKYRKTTSKKCWLYCHAAVYDFGWNFDDLAKRFGIEDAVLINSDMAVGSGVSDSDMRTVYNVSTFTALPTRGEGWGLGLSESMACGTPCIATPYSGHGSEGGWGLGAFEEIKIVAMDTEPVTGIDRAIADIDDCAAAMRRVMKPKRYKELVKAGLERAHSCAWDKILPQWEEIVDSTELPKWDYKEVETKDEKAAPSRSEVPCAWENPPKVTIVIPSSIILNRPNYDEVLKQCITALDSQTYTNWDLIVIDNVSHGGPMSSYLSHLKHTVLRWPFKYRPSKVLNRAISYASGSYYLFLHSDTTLMPDTLMKLMNTMKLKEDIGIIGAMSTDSENKKSSYGYEFSNIRTVQEKHRCEPGVTHVDGIPDYCMLVSAEAFGKAGGFDEDYHWWYHDVDLCQHMKSIGFGVVVDTSAECIHDGNTTQKYHDNSTKLIDTKRFNKNYGIQIS